MLKVLLFVVVAAVTIYLLLRALEHGRRGVRPAEPKRTIAPDDDIDFLRDIDRRQKRHDDPPKPDDS